MGTWNVSCRSSVNWGSLDQVLGMAALERLVIGNLPLKLLYPTIVLRRQPVESENVEKS